jgi:hypothetical protein
MQESFLRRHADRDPSIASRIGLPKLPVPIPECERLPLDAATSKSGPSTYRGSPGVGRLRPRHRLSYDAEREPSLVVLLTHRTPSHASKRFCICVAPQLSCAACQVSAQPAEPVTGAESQVDKAGKPRRHRLHPPRRRHRAARVLREHRDLLCTCACPVSVTRAPPRSRTLRSSTTLAPTCRRRSGSLRPGHGLGVRAVDQQPTVRAS